MRLKFVLSLVACSIGLIPNHSQASLVVVGSLQDEQGSGQGDWDPPHSTLIMSEKSGVFTVTAVNLTVGAPYLFKVLDEQGSGPASWGDPEIVSLDTLAYGGSNGTLSIRVDTNITNVSGHSQVWINSDVATLQVIGDFMDEAGGSSDWNPADPAFLMTSRGRGLYTFAASISTPGSYQFKATHGAGLDHQVGTDGAGVDAATYHFTTTRPNEGIEMSVDLGSRKLSVKTIPESASSPLRQH